MLSGLRVPDQVALTTTIIQVLIWQLQKAKIPFFLEITHVLFLFTNFALVNQRVDKKFMASCRQSIGIQVTPIFNIF